MARKGAKTYRLTLKINDDELVSSGNTILEAIESIKLPELFKTRGILSIAGEGKTCERNFNIMQLRRLRSNPTWREIVAKMLFMRLKDV